MKSMARKFWGKFATGHTIARQVIGFAETRSTLAATLREQKHTAHGTAVGTLYWIGDRCRGAKSTTTISRKQTCHAHHRSIREAHRNLPQRASCLFKLASLRIIGRWSSRVLKSAACMFGLPVQRASKVKQVDVRKHMTKAYYATIFIDMLSEYPLYSPQWTALRCRFLKARIGLAPYKRWPL